MAIPQPDRKEDFAEQIQFLASLNGQEFSTTRQRIIDQMRAADEEETGRRVLDQNCFRRLIDADIKAIRSKSPAANSPASVSLYAWMIGE